MIQIEEKMNMLLEIKEKAGKIELENAEMNEDIEDRKKANKKSFFRMKKSKQYSRKRNIIIRWDSI